MARIALVPKRFFNFRKVSILEPTRTRSARRVGGGCTHGQTDDGEEAAQEGEGKNTSFNE